MTDQTNVKTHAARLGLGLAATAAIAVWILILNYAPLWALATIVLPVAVYAVGYVLLDAIRSGKALKLLDRRP